MEIREATFNDIPELISLMEQLGYPTTVEKMEIRFNKIESNDTYHTIVAVTDRRVVGLLGMCTGLFYEYDGSYARILTLVVDSAYRKKGIGKKLIKEAENWARNQGVFSIGLNSGNREERKEAHSFYSNLGYVAKSTGFAKTLLN
ncbi:GNAT family N-acetyltransferase [Gottfriedia solisilvae]|uniref:GNAT family N-acetyltransferase n=1 Tax=Gottfriedia solisilvae TaxID=1516104 RepID=UPI003D2F3060